MAKLLSVADLAQLVGCSTRNIYRMIEAEEVPEPIRPGGRMIRWPDSVIEKWISAGCPKCPKSEQPTNLTEEQTQCHDGGEFDDE